MADLETLRINGTIFEAPQYTGGNNVDITDHVISVDLSGVAEQAAELYGAPLVANTVADMTDEERVYVYTGSEAGYTSGNWYYWNGNAWVSGGVYNSTAVETDKTLSISDMAADAKVTGDEITDLKSDLDDVNEALETKAEIDGYYEEMTVGDAEQLVATQYVEDSVPYLYRTSGGSADIGNREYVEAIVGGSIVLNQLFQRPANGTSNGVTFTSGDNMTEFVLNATEPSTGTVYRPLNNSLRSETNHVYYVSQGVANANVQIYNDSNGVNTEGNKDVIRKSTGVGTFYVRVASGATFDNVKFTGRIVDLTQKLGSTVADYLYSLESATAGAGISKLKSWGFLQKDYYEYNDGSMEHVSGVSAHEMVGFNQWDEEWVNAYHNAQGEQIADTRFISCKNKIRVLPNTTYYFKSPNVDFELFEYDSNGDFIRQSSTSLKNTTFTTGTNAEYIEFSSRVANALTAYNHDICINLHWSGTRDGEYEPYVKHTYALDPTVTLRGIPKTDASGNLYYDGDIWHPDGTIDRRYGVVDLGTLTWTKGNALNAGGGYVYYINSNSIGRKIGTQILSEMTVRTGALSWEDLLVGDIYAVSNNIVVGLSASSVADAKTELSGKYMVYELATPTTETATPYNEVQIVDDWGTEEYVSTSIVPVGHNTRYPQNLRDKLQHLPNLADSDGNYLIQQTGTQMDLVAFHIPKATGLADGTYTLKATVSGGTPTYTWEAES